MKRTTIKSEKLPPFPQKWSEALKNYWPSKSKEDLLKKIQSEYNNEIIFPEIHNIWNAFALTPPDRVKVIILGQDPYPNMGQANGLSFSVDKGVETPPSLKNILKLYSNNTGFSSLRNGDLRPWAMQGALLINSSLTVRKKSPGSHVGLPYEFLLNAVFSYLNETKSGLVFWLLGNHAHLHSKNIDGNKHLCLKTAHPSPLAAYRGFHESQLFIKTNDYLKKKQVPPIKWSLEP